MMLSSFAHHTPTLPSPYLLLPCPPACTSLMVTPQQPCRASEGGCWTLQAASGDTTWTLQDSEAQTPARAVPTPGIQQFMEDFVQCNLTSAGASLIVMQYCMDGSGKDDAWT